MTRGEAMDITEKLKSLLKLSSENEIVEFKTAKNNFDFDDLGEYFSALSNEANLKRQSETIEPSLAHTSGPIGPASTASKRKSPTEPPTGLLSSRSMKSSTNKVASFCFKSPLPPKASRSPSMATTTVAMANLKVH
jgi:hypothetical protein